MQGTAQQWPLVHIKRSCLLVVDVQPEYWSKCQQIKKDFPDFPTKCGETISLCRNLGVETIFIRADYRISHSPWLRQFRRVSQTMTGAAKVEPICDGSGNCEKWEDFAVPEKTELVIGKPSWNATSGRFNWCAYTFAIVLIQTHPWYDIICCICAHSLSVNQ